MATLTITAPRGYPIEAALSSLRRLHGWYWWPFVSIPGGSTSRGFWDNGHIMVLAPDMPRAEAIVLANEHARVLHDLDVPDDVAARFLEPRRES